MALFCINGLSGFSRKEQKENFLKAYPCTSRRFSNETEMKKLNILVLGEGEL